MACFSHSTRASVPAFKDATHSTSGCSFRRTNEEISGSSSMSIARYLLRSRCESCTVPSLSLLTRVSARKRLKTNRLSGRRKRKDHIGRFEPQLYGVNDILQLLPQFALGPIRRSCFGKYPIDFMGKRDRSRFPTLFDIPRQFREPILEGVDRHSPPEIACQLSPDDRF